MRSESNNNETDKKRGSGARLSPVTMASVLRPRGVHVERILAVARLPARDVQIPAQSQVERQLLIDLPTA